MLAPAPSISGGPLAILEYAERFRQRGHVVTITTYPDSMWLGDNPFPWFKFGGEIHYKRLRNSAAEQSLSLASLRLLGQSDAAILSKGLLSTFGVDGFANIILRSADQSTKGTGAEFLAKELIIALQIMDVMPDCDLNIATFWTTTFPVFFSGKGKPVYFMQHYEEVFYPLETSFLLQRLGVRTSCELPLFKVANSSWLQGQIKGRFGQDVPFSNNALVVDDFAPKPKKSETDGIIRIVTYVHPAPWKGFADAVKAMTEIRRRYGARLEWNVFGYPHPLLDECSRDCPITYHPKLSFAQLADLYATSDIALCASWYESFPLPPLEAMASGTAVVTTDAGTEDYAFDRKNSLIVPARRVDQMIAALSELIEDTELRTRLACEGRRTAEEFTWERAVRDREEILMAIHRGEVAYDTWKPAKLGLLDGNGIPFENAPADLAWSDTTLFWRDGALYLLHNKVRHYVECGAVIPVLLDNDITYGTIDELAFARTPSGPPIRSWADVPSDLLKNTAEPA